MKPYKIEVCIETIEEAQNAYKKGADQLEICSNLERDGLTPSLEMCRKIRASCPIPLKIMVRPHDLSFEYNEEDIEVIFRTIKTFVDEGFNHFVFGGLKANQIDIQLLKSIFEAYPEIIMTFHKAIDVLDNPTHEVIKLKQFNNIKFVLSSGGAKTAIDGVETLKKMQSELGENVQIIAAGSIIPEILPQLHNNLQFKLYHGRNILK